MGEVLVIGLTGGIGTGKSTLASQLEKMGAKVINADTIVHTLLAPGGGAVEEVARVFPQVKSGLGIDRKRLGEIVFGHEEQLNMLEDILHPLVVVAENEFVRKQTALGAKIIVLDIPLLFETGADDRCSVVIVASAPLFLQKQRVMKRPGMSKKKFYSIVAHQLPERQKRMMANAVIATGLGKGVSWRALARFLGELNAS